MGLYFEWPDVSHLGRWLEGLWACLCIYGPHLCSFLFAISSSWTWTPRANPCHGQGGRCQVPRGHLSPADVHNQRHEQCPLGLVVHRQEHWHLSSDGKKVPAATRLSCLDLVFLSGLSMSTKFAVCFEFHFCWTSYSCLRSGGCGHGARVYLDNKSTEH